MNAACPDEALTPVLQILALRFNATGTFQNTVAETRGKYVDLTANSNTTSAHEDFTPASRNDSEEALSDKSEDDDDVTLVPLAEALPDLDEVLTLPTTDFQDENPASPASSFPDDEPTSPAEASSDEVDHEADGQAAGGRSLTDGKFLGVLELIDTLTVSKRGLPSIPMGRKENTLFIIQNQRNMDRRAVGQGCSFTADCGAWKPRPSPVTRMVKNGERWQSIILRGDNVAQKSGLMGKRCLCQQTHSQVKKISSKCTERTTS